MVFIQDFHQAISINKLAFRLSPSVIAQISSFLRVEILSSEGASILGPKCFVMEIFQVPFN